MTKRASIVLSLAALAGILAFSSAAPAAALDSSKPLTCEGRCQRQNQNCLKSARGSREVADCQFENHACIAKCEDRP